MIKAGERIADDAIYLNEDRYEKPKELFKFIADKLPDGNGPLKGNLLDVGCATGELIYYLKKRFPEFRFTGVDVSEPMIAQAKKKMPLEQFAVTSIQDASFFEERQFNVITCSGVINIFDDVAPLLDHLLGAVRFGGRLLIVGPFNDSPVDVLMRYRTVSEATDENWQSGWNITSKFTAEKLLEKSGYAVDVAWHPFAMPFALSPQKDPMRTWTLKTEKNPFQLVNGACQLVDLQLLDVRVKRK